MKYSLPSSLVHVPFRAKLNCPESPKKGKSPGASPAGAGLWGQRKDITHLTALGPGVSELAVLLRASCVQEPNSQQNLFIICHKESQL